MSAMERTVPHGGAIHRYPKAGGRRKGTATLRVPFRERRVLRQSVTFNRGRNR